MTISTTNSRINHNGNGVTTDFSFPYRFLADADLVVILTNASGVDIPQTITTHYTLVGEGLDAGGTVTMLTPPAPGEVLTIYRDMILTQEVDYIEGDSFPSTTHETALDRLTMIAQQHADQINRSIVRSETSTSTGSLNLPDPIAQGILSFDTNENLVVTQELGTYRGTDATTTTTNYVVRDLVKSTTAGQLNNVYICILSSPSGTLLTNTTYWRLVVDAVSAATSETNAASSAAAALVSEGVTNDNVVLTAADVVTTGNNATAAQAAQAAAELILDTFDDRYLGEKSSAPVVDNDGNPLQVSAEYWDTVLGVRRTWSGTTWVTSGAATAAGIVNVPSGGVAATDVQSAINELDSEKEPSLTPASQVEMEAGTEIAIRSMSPIRVKQAIDALSSDMIGVGQTWQNLTVSRSLGTIYTNSTGKTIQVIVSANVTVAGASATITVDGVALITARTASYELVHSFLVKDGGTYKVDVTAGGLFSWSELR